MGVEVTVDRGLAEVRLDAPQGNLLDSTAITALARAIDIVGHDSAIRFVVLHGAGDEFCAGRRATAGLSGVPAIREDLEPILAVSRAIASCEVPLAAAVEGSAHGFGFNVAARADLTYAGADATFALPELARGVPPLFVLTSLGGLTFPKLVMRLALTGAQLTAQEAQAMGLVTEVVTSGRALERARAVGRTVCDELRPDAVRILRAFAHNSGADPDRMTAAADTISTYLAGRQPADERSKG